MATQVEDATAAGLLDGRWLLWAAVSLPVSLIGTRLGLSLYGRFNDEQFRQLILAMLGVSGIVLIATSVLLR